MKVKFCFTGGGTRVELVLDAASVTSKDKTGLSQALASHVRRELGWTTSLVPTIVILDQRVPYSALQPLQCAALIAERYVQLESTFSSSPDSNHVVVNLLCIPILASWTRLHHPGTSTRRNSIDLNEVFKRTEFASTQLAECLVENGFAFLKADSRLIQSLRSFRQHAQSYIDAALYQPSLRWHETFSEGQKFVGFSCSEVRPFWQMREPQHPETWPPSSLQWCLDQASCPHLAHTSLTAFQHLDAVACACLAAIQSVLTEELPTLISPPTTSAKSSYGSSVLRLYKYQASSATTISCGLHADLGLLSVAPKASRPGLEVVDSKRGVSVPVDEMMGDDEIVVFVGETLAKLSDGFFRPTLHHVVPSGEERFSMVFFQRPDTNATFPSDGMDVGSFTVQELFFRRWWRSIPSAGEIEGKSLDY